MNIFFATIYYPQNSLSYYINLNFNNVVPKKNKNKINKEPLKEKLN